MVKPEPVCGISVVKREIAVVFTTAISHLTTEIPQTGFGFDHLKGTPFRGECPSFVYSGANTEEISPYLFDFSQ